MNVQFGNEAPPTHARVPPQPYTSTHMPTCLPRTSTSTYPSLPDQQVRRVEAAHGDEVSSLFCPRGGGGAAASGQLLASGDEAGGIKVWDMRAEKAVYSYKKHKDYISGFGLQQKDSCLLAVSGDGTLSAHDLRANKFRCGGVALRQRGESPGVEVWRCGSGRESRCGGVALWQRGESPGEALVPMLPLGFKKAKHPVATGAVDASLAGTWSLGWDVGRSEACRTMQETKF
eukprot:352480-Chlamydomonas_euryale.AAC.6